MWTLLNPLKSRGDRIRTCDLLVPNQSRYQAAPRPEAGTVSGRLSGCRPGDFDSLESLATASGVCRQCLSERMFT